MRIERLLPPAQPGRPWTVVLEGGDALRVPEGTVAAFSLYDGLTLEEERLAELKMCIRDRIYSSNGLTLSGTMPGTGDITQVQSYQEVATWKGVSSQTGERITAVSAPLLYNGELVGIMRYVTSMRLVDRQEMCIRDRLCSRPGPRRWTRSQAL